MQSRRQFIQATASTALAFPVAATLQAQDSDTEWRNQHERMLYRQLGKTGFMVSEVVMGGNEINPNNYEHVVAALDQGLNYLDTSPVYGKGQSELGFQKVLKARPRDQFFLTSKVSLWDVNRGTLYRQIFDSLSAAKQKQIQAKVREEIESSGAAHDDYLLNYFGSQRKELETAVLSNLMEKEYGREIDRDKNYKQIIFESVDGSLKRLQTDHLDILMCPHGASSSAELLNYPEIFDAFDQLKQAGKVRHLGVSSHSDPAGVLKTAAKSGRYAVAMVAYNIVNHPFMTEALSEAKQAGVGTIAMKVARPLYAGPNRAPAAPQAKPVLEAAIPGPWSLPQKAYLWALQNRDLSAVISNMVNADQVAQNLPLPMARLRA